jgi:hypothetical protein
MAPELLKKADTPVFIVCQEVTLCSSPLCSDNKVESSNIDTAIKFNCFKKLKHCHEVTDGNLQGGSVHRVIQMPRGNFQLPGSGLLPIPVTSFSFTLFSPIGKDSPISVATTPALVLT